MDPIGRQDDCAPTSAQENPSGHSQSLLQVWSTQVAETQSWLLLLQSVGTSHGSAIGRIQLLPASRLQFELGSQQTPARQTKSSGQLIIGPQ